MLTQQKIDQLKADEKIIPTENLAGQELFTALRDSSQSKFLKIFQKM